MDPMSGKKRTTALAPRDKELTLISLHCLAALIGLILLMLSHAVVDQDVWHEMALARELFQSGSLPLRDVFAYTPTVDFIQHEWGAGVIAYLLTEWFGGNGLLLLKYGLGVLLILFAVLRLRMDAPPLVALAPAVLLSVNMLQPGFGTVRGQLYSLVAVAALLWFLALDRRGNRRWMGPWLAIFVLWLNVHGGFILAFGILGAAWLERAARGKRDWHLVGLGAAMLAAVAINPYGLRYYPYMVEALTIRRPDITEWQPVWVMAAEFPASFIALALSVLLMAYALRVRGWRDSQGIAVLLLLLLLSVRTSRITMFYGLAFLCIVPGLLRGTPLALWMDRALRRWASIALPVTALFAMLLLGAAWVRKPWSILVPGVPLPGYGAHVVYPVGAVDYLKRHRFQGNLMVSFSVGAYAMWKLYPEAKVSMDSRYEVAYPPELAEKFIRLYSTGEQAAEVLGAYPHDAVLMHVRSPLRQAVEAGDRWRCVYDDGVYALYAKRDSPLPAELGTEPVRNGSIP